MGVLIIGGSGFVGSRLIQLLGRDSCLNIDKRQSEINPEITIIADIRNQDLAKSIPDKIETVVLLAAEHRDDVSPTSQYYDVNVEGTKNVLKVMADKGIKNIIFTSSVAVFGLNKPNPNEDYPVDPFNHYGKSKYQAEEVLINWQKQDPARSVTIIRPTVIFGENNRGNVYNLLKQIASGSFRMVGEGTNRKSMAYVGNVVAFIKYRILNCRPGVHIYNYIDKPDMTMNELVNQVESSLEKKLSSIRFPYWAGMLVGFGFDILSMVTRKKFAISSVRVKKFCATTQFDSTKAHALGFVAPFTLAEGLNRTLQFEFLQEHDENRIIFESE